MSPHDPAGPPAMKRYRVIDTRPALQLAALRDPLGRHCVVRVRAQLPPIDTELRTLGTLRRGQRALLADPEGWVYDTLVEAEPCTQTDVFERMHGPALGPAPATVPRGRLPVGAPAHRPRDAS